MASKTINISLDEKLIKAIDKAAKAEYTSRSDYIRNSVVLHLKDLETETEASRLDKEYKKFADQYGQTLKNLANR